MVGLLSRVLCASGLLVLVSVAASAATIPVGYVSYDVTGPNTAQFEVVNLTGPNSSGPGDTSFPVATAVPISDLSLTVQYADGTSHIFGPSYFVLSTDGLSYDGEQLSTLSGDPTGFYGATAATLTGMFDLSAVVLNDGSAAALVPTFSVALADPGGLADGDLAVIGASPVPEPGSWMLLLTGMAGAGLLWRGRRNRWASRGALMMTAGATVLFSGSPSAHASTVKLTTATSPSTGAAGTTQVSVTGSGFPSGAISPGGVNVSVAATCGASGVTAAATAVQKVVGTTEKVQFVLPGTLAPGTYAVSLSGTDSNGTPFDSGASCSSVQVTAGPSPVLKIDTSVATDWKISNGALSIDFNPVGGNINGLRLGNSANLLDLTNLNKYGPKGFYMDNSGFGTGTGVPGYVNTGVYIDWWVTYPSSSSNAFTYSEHYVVTPNDPGFHVYFVANHATTDIGGSIGQVQWVFREDLNQFPNTYSVRADLSNPGPTVTTVPVSTEAFSTDPGRAVQDATVDLHGFTDLPANFKRSFYTKYDYSSYEYQHQAHGVFGSQYGAWVVIPSHESMVGGPTKQDLIFTGNLDMIEAYSSHLDNPITLTTPAGTASSRLFGPFYVRMNKFGGAINTPADMYNDALTAGMSFTHFYDSEQQLVAAGYVPSTTRGNVQVQVTNVAGAPQTAWAVLSDPNKNFQVSSAGAQYWADISSTGSATFTGVIPGTYRLSVYSLGQWGELRQDGIAVTAGQTTVVPTMNFAQENFGTPVFTIGTADRSAHEFLHGHDAQGHDDREYWGTWNYWADFQGQQGAVVYNATAGPAGPATNNLDAWNYNHWQIFDPGLYGGVYNSGDDTTDGYTYAIPTYVKALPGASGSNGVTTKAPPWTVHFATPQDASGYNYVVLSTALAAAEASYVITLNGQQLIWSRANQSDAAVRSGLSGYTQWVAFQWDRSVLNPAGQENVLTLSVSATQGIEDDALRMELTNTSADPGVRGWNDYEYLYKTTDVKAADAKSNP